MTENNTFPVCLSAKDAQRMTGWSRSMTYSLLRNTEAGAFQVGKRRFFHRDKLLKWLEEQSGTRDPGKEQKA